MPTDLTGRPIFDLPTPSLVIDLDKVEVNISSMQKLVQDHGRALRPHIKTHKSSRIAKMQIGAGALGVTCATIGEAEAMAAAGIEDILIANQLVTEDKLERARRLLEVSRLKFVVDSFEGIQIAQQAAKKFGCIYEILVEVDVGGKRCGTQSPLGTLALVQKILDSSGLRFMGFQAYNGGISYFSDLAERELQSQITDQILCASIDIIRPISPIAIVSGAGTGHVANMLQIGTLTEYQSGTYVYTDTTYHKLEPGYSPALFVLSTTLSSPSPDRVTMDVGLKGMGTEFSEPLVSGYSNLVKPRFSEEHLTWQVSAGVSPKIGEKVLLIPSHVCTTVNHYRSFFAARAGMVVGSWQIDAF